MSWYRFLTLLSIMWLVVLSSAAPARRYPMKDLEARRRSAVDRSMIRLGKSWPPPVTVADLKEALEHSARFGKNYPHALLAALENQNPQLRQAFLQLDNENQHNPLIDSSNVEEFRGKIVSTDDLLSLLKYLNNEDFEAMSKRGMNFLRLGRDTKFIRFGKSDPEKPNDYDDNGNILKWSTDGNQPRIARARNHFLRLGRDSEDLNNGFGVDDAFEDRKKRSTTVDCDNCHN